MAGPLGSLIRGGLMEQLEPWCDALDALKPGEEYLNRTEKLLYRRLWEYILAEDWRRVGKVVSALRGLRII